MKLNLTSLAQGIQQREVWGRKTQQTALESMQGCEKETEAQGVQGRKEEGDKRLRWTPIDRMWEGTLCDQKSKKISQFCICGLILNATSPQESLESSYRLG